MNKVRHAFYILGNSRKESLKNCEKFDKITNAFDELIELKKLIDSCKDNKKIQYANKLLNLDRKYPTTDNGVVEE